MVLARLSRACGDELICDMAETYHVLNWRELPLRTAAVLACGLSGESRAARKLRGEKYRTETILMTAILDELRWLVWAKSKDAAKGKNRPKSLVRQLMGKPEQQNKLTAFNSPEEFNERLKQITEGDSNG